MTLTIGRIGTDITLDPMSIRMRASGGNRQFTISGEMAPTDADAAKSIRNELYRMSRNEDLMVPLTYSVDSSLDGFYRLDSAELSIGLVSLSGWYPFRAVLTPFGSAGMVAVESRIIGGLRANDHSISSAGSEPWHGVPSNMVGYDPGGVIPAKLTRAGASSESVIVWRDIDTTISPLWSVDPSNFYEGAAEVKVGATLRLLSGLDCENLPNDWELNNGLIRVTPNGTGGRLDIEVFTGGSWSSLKTVRIRRDSIDVGQWDLITVLRNDAAAVTIRLVRNVAAGGAMTLDLTLRRGAVYVESRLSYNVSDTLSILLLTAEPATLITGGIRATSNDGDSNRYVFGTSKTFSTDLIVGGIFGVAITTWDFFFGFEIAGSAAVSGNAAADIVNQYHGYVTETLSPVHR